MGALRCAPRTPAGRRRGGRSRAVARGDSYRARAGRQRVPRSRGAGRRRLAAGRASGAGACAPHSQPSGHGGAVRPGRVPPGARRLPRLDSDGARARALFAGLAAHSVLPLEAADDRGFGLVIGCAGARGRLAVPARRRAAYRRRARSLPPRARRRDPHRRARRRRSTSCRRPRIVLLDVTPRQLPQSPDSAAGALPPRARALPLRAGRVQAGLGARCAGPLARRPNARARRRCTSAVRSTRSPRRSGAVAGRGPERPFVLLAQPSLFDPTRAPAGKAHGVGLLPRAARHRRRT